MAGELSCPGGRPWTTRRPRARQGPGHEDFAPATQAPTFGAPSGKRLAIFGGDRGPSAGPRSAGPLRPRLLVNIDLGIGDGCEASERPFAIRRADRGDRRERRRRVVRDQVRVGDRRLAGSLCPIDSCRDRPLGIGFVRQNGVVRGRGGRGGRHGREIRRDRYGRHNGFRLRFRCIRFIRFGRFLGLAGPAFFLELATVSRMRLASRLFQRGDVAEPQLRVGAGIEEGLVADLLQGPRRACSSAGSRSSISAISSAIRACNCCRATSGVGRSLWTRST